MTLFFPMLYALTDIGHAFVLYYIVFYLLFLATFTRLSKQITGTNLFTSFYWTFLAGILLISLNQIPIYAQTILDDFFTVHWHSGAILVGLMASSIILDAIKNKFTVISAILFFILCFLGSFSDKIIIVQFFIPLVVTLFFFYIRRLISRQILLITLGLIVLGVSVSTIITKLLTNVLNLFQAVDYKILFPENSFEISTNALIFYLEYFFTNITILLLASIVSFIACIIILYQNRKYFFYKKSNLLEIDSLTRLFLFFITFYLLLVLASVAFPLIINVGKLAIVSGDEIRFGLDTGIRWSQPAYILSFFILAIIISKYRDRLTFGFKAGISITIFILYFVAIIFQAQYFELKNLNYPYPEEVQCFDDLASQYNVKNGLGLYQYARRWTIISRAGLRINGLRSNLEIRSAINNLAWYREDPQKLEGEYLEYQFIVTYALDKELITQKFGTPAYKERCGQFEVYIYNKEKDVAFRRFGEQLLGEREKDIPVYDNLIKSMNDVLKAESYGEATMIAKEAIHLSPNDYEAYVGLARAHIGNEESEQSKNALDQALELAPKTASAYHLIADTYRLLGEIEQAIELYKEVLTIDPDYKNTYGIQSKLAVSYLSLGQGEKAVEAAQQATLLSPDNFGAYVWLSRSYLAVNKVELALSNLEKAEMLAPDTLHTYNLIANTYLSLDEAERAIELYHKALLIDPNEVTVRASLARAYRSLGMDAEVIRELEKIIKIDPKHEKADWARQELVNLQ